MQSLHTKRVAIFIALALFVFTGTALLQTGALPTINAAACVYYPDGGVLVLKGSNFQTGASVAISNAGRLINYERVKVKGSKKILITGIAPADVGGGLDVKVTVNGLSSELVHIVVSAVDPTKLTESDVKTIIAQAVAQAEASNLKATIAITDKEGNVLGVFQMTGAPANTVVGAGKCSGRPPLSCGLENVPVPSCTAAISKAVTGAFLSSQGHAFSTRTASFIVQEHFPPLINFQAGGPLFGVQFSQLEVCSDVNAKSPLGLSADPGGLPLYKNGLQVGGIGIEGDGKYGADLDPTDKDVPVEELVAVAATRGFEAPANITGDKIIVNGIRFPYVNAQMPAAIATPAFASLRGAITQCRVPDIPTGTPLAPPQVVDTPASEFMAATLGDAPPGRINKRLFMNGAQSFRAGTALSVSEVTKILTQAAKQAFITRAAIRQPENSPAEVNISVVDVNGDLLGAFSTADAPIFGFDVCVQKARTAAFFSNTIASARLRSVGLGRYVDAAAKDGIRLDGSIAFSDRGQGFLTRPFFPDGIDDTPNGPFSVPIEEFSPFNVGLQLDLVTPALVKFLTTGMLSKDDCTGIPELKNGIQIFAGSVPLFKGGRLVGAIGISGDGIDQDDLVAAMGSTGFEAPLELRCDTVLVRGARLPFVKFPRNPNRQ
ncbi:MAG: heme-binding protein [Acidobacteria bacterium]|nr:heme-binding protein [Acidobacteriota bacterium]